MNLPALVRFRQCTLSDKELSEKVAKYLEDMYTPPGIVPLMHITARPNEDFDLLLAELILRFNSQSDILQSYIDDGDH